MSLQKQHFSLCRRALFSTAALVGIATALGLALPAAAQQVSSGEKNVKLAISGQVNRAILWADDGDDSEVFFVDNDNSSTRLRFVGIGRFDQDISVGTQIEVQMESNSTADIKIDQDSAVGGTSFTERKLEIYADHRKYGRLWLGQGESASDGTSEIDLSGTGVIGSSDVADFAGGIEFGGSGGPEIGEVFDNFDGLGRDDRIRYDSPNFNGFKGSIGFVQQDDGLDLAVRYTGAFDSFRLAAGLAGAKTDEFDQFNISVSALLDSGLNLTLAGGVRDLDQANRDDPSFGYFKVGYQFSPFSVGRTSLALDLAFHEDTAADDTKATAFGIYAVQAIERIGTEVYLGYRNHSLNVPGANPDDINGVMFGARIKF